MKYQICLTLVNANSKKELIKSLKTLFENSKDSDLRIAVAIVDNNSHDNIREVESMFPHTQVLIRDKNYGFGSSQNVAMTMFDAEYYFVLNPDTEFFGENNTLKMLYNFMEKNKYIGIVAPKIVYPDGSLQYSCYRFPYFTQPFFSRAKFNFGGKTKKINDRFLMKDFDHSSPQPVDWVMGSAMFVRQKAIAEVGGFDEIFWMYAEDSDWCRRMWEGNWPVYYVHDIVIQHAHGRGSAKVPGVFKALIKNKLARVHLLSWLKYFWKWKGKEI